jgi:hypothetical protein
VLLIVCCVCSFLRSIVFASLVVNTFGNCIQLFCFPNGTVCRFSLLLWWLFDRMNSYSLFVLVC